MSNRLSSTAWPSTGPTKMPLSVSTPSTSRPRRRTRRASGGVNHARAAQRSSVRLDQVVEPVERPLGGGVARGPGRIGMGLEKEPVGAGHGRRGEQRRECAPAGLRSRRRRPAPAAAPSGSRRTSPARPWPRAAARSSACRPRGRRSRRRCRARSPPRRRCRRSAPSPGRRPSPPAASTGPSSRSPAPGAPRGDEQVGLAAEKRRDLERVGDLGGRRGLRRLVDVGQHRQPAGGAHPLEQRAGLPPVPGPRGAPPRRGWPCRSWP